jgi:hypothetical protein
VNWRGEIPRATPLSAFLVGLFTSGALRVGLQQDPSAFLGQFIISLFLITSAAIWFDFVVRGRDYEFKWAYGFKDLKVRDLVRSICWLAGVTVIIFITSFG